MPALWQDLRYGIRQLLRNPGFTVVAVLTLALGIGANTTIFSIFNAFLLRPLPLAQPENLVQVAAFDRKEPSRLLGVSYEDFLDWRRGNGNQVFEDVAAYREESFTLKTKDLTERVSGALVTSNLLSVIGVSPAEGRPFLPADDEFGSERSTIVGRALARRLFGDERFALGQTFNLNGQSFGVVGIMPSDFKFPEFAEVWIPIAAYEQPRPAGRGDRIFEVVGRLRARKTVLQAQAQMSAISDRLAHEYPATNQTIGITVRAFDAVRQEGREAFPLLFGAVGFVLLIACANVASLLLARGATRQKEMAVRAALGATRWHILRQLLTESFLLAALGGGLGLLASVWFVELMVSAIPVETPYWLRFEIDGRVLLFTLGCCLLTTFLFGIAPAVRAYRPDPYKALKEGGVRSDAPGGRRWSRLLVVFELALALLLVAGATLMGRSLLRLYQLDLGYEPRGLWTMNIELLLRRDSSTAAIIPFHEEVLDRIGRIAGVQAVASAATVDVRGAQSFQVAKDTAVSQDAEFLQLFAISPEYFRAMKILLRQGRFFTQQDRVGAQPVVIINEAMAQAVWPGENPVGNQLKLGSSQAEGPWLTIVGVVGDVRHPGLYRTGVQARVGPELYVPFDQFPTRTFTLHVRASETSNLASQIAGAVSEVDKEHLAFYGFQGMEGAIRTAVWPLRAFSMLFGAFAACGLFLAVVGLYGVVSYTTAQRTHEIGIRMALGAQPHNISRLVLGQGMKLVGIGMGTGLLAAWALTRLLVSLLFQVAPTDPMTFVVVPILFAFVALLASYLPARHAMRIDPMTALRYE